jgi:antitoxin (DNA-binding transcriptional repressor) of toxin-antitoxin stability system
MACGCGIGCDTGLVSHHRATYLDVRRHHMSYIFEVEANHDFFKLLSRVERGEEILITKWSKPVALLSPYQVPRLTAERQAAIKHAIEVMAQGLPWGATLETFTRDEMHER